MKKLLLLPALFIFAILSGAVWFYLNIQPVSENKVYKDFLITRGSSATQIGNKLESAGLVKNSFAFKLYLQIFGQANKIQSGEYRLSPSMSVTGIVQQLLKGPVEIWVTVPEGLRREEIAERFAGALEKDTIFVNQFLQVSSGKEGYLFPDTYLFPREASASAVVGRMIATFDSKTSDLEIETSLTLKETIILASILERETKTDEERPLVAGVLIKRLNAGWPLQVDASTQYAVANARCKVTCDKWWQPLTAADLNISSQYNTYKFSGLPPTPISNPGLSSLKAAFKPVASDYWYYIHDGEGQIHFARTLEEHNENIAKYLQ